MSYGDIMLHEIEREMEITSLQWTGRKNTGKGDNIDYYDGNYALKQKGKDIGGEKEKG